MVRRPRLSLEEVFDFGPDSWNFESPFGILFLSNGHQLQMGDQSMNVLYAENLKVYDLSRVKTIICLECFCDSIMHFLFSLES